MLVQLHLQSAPVKNQMFQFDCIFMWRYCRLVHFWSTVNRLRRANHTLSSGLNNRQPLHIIQVSVRHASINAHTAINAFTHSVCVVPNSIPPPVREGNHEGMPAASTLYPLQLAITSQVSDRTLGQKGMICLGMRKNRNKWQWICSA